jgi:hypothetical protein
MSNLDKNSDHIFDENQAQRRKVISMLGAGAVALPVLGLSACGGESSPQSGAAAPSAASGDTMEKAMSDATSAAESMADEAQSTMADAQDSAEEMMASAEADVGDAMDSASEAVDDTMADAQDVIAKESAGGMPHVDENGAQATGLSYKHDATDIDASAQPRYAAGQQCSNCVLFQGGDAAWGGCPLFAGQQVKATGWCSAYAAAS